MARHPFFKRKNHETLKCGGSGRLPLRQVPCIQEGKTKFDYNSFMFECPGGKIEPGETLKQTLKRELMEEMNYEIEVGKELVTVTHMYPDFSITMTAFLCTAASPTFVMNEHVSFEWMKVENLKELDWAAADVGIVNAIIADSYPSN